MRFDPTSDYPLGTRRPDLVATPNGVPLADVTLDAVRAGLLDSAEIRATAKTLSMQAEVALASGRRRLAANLERAAELAAVPDELLLDVYTALRPGRATAAELEQWAVRLDGYGATATAAFVRQAVAAYVDRGLLADG
jgi:propanediol dehydratase small subunit